MNKKSISDLIKNIKLEYKISEESDNSSLNENDAAKAQNSN